LWYSPVAKRAADGLPPTAEKLTSLSGRIADHVRTQSVAIHVRAQAAAVTFHGRIDHSRNLQACVMHITLWSNNYGNLTKAAIPMDAAGYLERDVQSHALPCAPSLFNGSLE
jgi:hypothetical protein